MAAFANDVRLRSERLGDGDQLTPEQIQQLNTYSDNLIEDLGIDLGPNWEKPVPKSGDVPRMFVLRRDDNGFDHPLDLEAAGVQPGTAEFWKEIQLGNVFAYPAGESDPVQLQVGHHEGKPRLEYSRQVPPDYLPDPPTPRKPSLWMRFAGLFGGYKKERALWDNRVQSKNQRLQTLQSMSDRRLQHHDAEKKAAKEALQRLTDARKRAFLDSAQPVIENENQEINLESGNVGERKSEFIENKIIPENKPENKKEEKIEEPKEEKKAEEKKAEGKPEEKKEAQKVQKKVLPTPLENAYAKLGQNEKSMKLMTSIFQPQPELDTSKGVLYNEDHKYALYDKEQFDSLKQYPKDGPEGIDLSKIQVGNSGKTVMPEEFAAVTMYALWQPESLKAGLKHQGDDPYMMESLIGLKNDAGKPLFEEKNILNLVTGFSRGWWTTDLFMVPPRSNEGSYFKDVTNVGRKIAVEAFQDYAKGDKQKLAKLVADGINMAADDLRNVEGSIYEQQRAVMHTSGKLLDLLRKDTELAELAIQSGLKKEKVQIVNGLRTLESLEQESRKAAVILLKAEQEKRPVSKEEKLKCIKAMLKPRIALKQLGAENLKVMDGDKIQAKTLALYTNCKPLSKIEETQFKENPLSRPKPEPGKIWMDTAQNVMNSLAKVYGQDSKTLLGLGDPKGNSLNQLDALAGEVYKVADLENKNITDLVKDLDTHNAKPNLNLSQHLEKAVENIKAKQRGGTQQTTTRKTEKSYDGPVLGGGK